MTEARSEDLSDLSIEDLHAEVRWLRAEVAALRQSLSDQTSQGDSEGERAAALESALLALPVGVAIYDAQDRLVLKNNRFQLYDDTGERDPPGTPFLRTRPSKRQERSQPHATALKRSSRRSKALTAAR